MTELRQTLCAFAPLREALRNLAKPQRRKGLIMTLALLCLLCVDAEAQRRDPFQGFGPPQRREPWRPTRPSGPPM